MSSSERRQGRVFCVTGVSAEMGTFAAPPSSIKCSSGSLSSQCDTESNTSGYISSSSFESSGEEKLLIPNEDKVFRVWNQWSLELDANPGPKSSTPKQASEGITMRRRVNISTEAGKSMLAIKKVFSSDSKRSDSSSNQISSDDSFWGIRTPRVQKSSSEGDIHKGKITCDNSWKRKPLPLHDAGMEIQTSSYKGGPHSQEWRRRPFVTQSTSQEDLRAASTTNRPTSDRTSYSALPRYRVTVPASQPFCYASATNKLASHLSKSCADFVDTGVSVDDSMTEFFSNVNKENLAGFLDFYDRVTSGPAYERARRNPNNYEAVLF
ncbi:uncharacterized protein LOC128229729 isoform X2 [Mya arenaria]|nr:uncharacterized protein LOC128229729 isoform X2 [Mya arenaria]